MTHIPKKYWIVIGARVSTAPHKHGSSEEARQEAERLAKKYPGVAFDVLESISTVVKTEVTWTPHHDRLNCECTDCCVPF